MSERAAPLSAPAGPLRRAGRTLRALYDVLLGEPMRGGRLRLEGLSGPAWVLSVAGLVVLSVLVGSVALNEAWRTGPLVHVGSQFGRAVFLPVRLLPVTLVVLGLAWLLVLWGSSRASVSWKVAGAVAFLVINAPISRPLVVALGDDPALSVGPELVRASYWAVPALVVLTALADRREWATRVIGPAILGLMVAGLAGFFGGLLWVHLGTESAGLLQYVPNFISGAFQEVETLLLPLVFFGALAIVQFNHGLADVVAVTSGEAPRRWALALLAGLVAGKLWIQLVRHAGSWAELVGQRPDTAAFTLAMLAALVGGTALARRHRAPRPSGEVAERIVYGTAIAAAVPGLVTLFVLSTQQLMVTQLSWLAGARFLLRFPFDAWLSWADVGVGVLGVALGIRLLTREGGSEARRDAGLGLLLVFGWASAFHLTDALGVDAGFSPPLLDLALTVAAAAFLAVRWRAMGTSQAAALAAILVFSWLIATEGDWIGILAGFMGLPVVVVVLFGMVYTLLADSAFASGASRTLPRDARPLLFIGYLVLSLTLLNWLEATHGVHVTGEAGSRAFRLFGFPLGAWLVARQPFTLAAEEGLRSGSDRLPS